MVTFTDWIHYNNLSYAEGKDRFDRNLAVNIVPQGASSMVPKNSSTPGFVVQDPKFKAACAINSTIYVHILGVPSDSMRIL